MTDADTKDPSASSATSPSETNDGDPSAPLPETDIKMTLIEPGMTDTPFFESRPTSALEADDIARAVMFAISQPAHVDVNEVLVRPIHQPV